MFVIKENIVKHPVPNLPWFSGSVVNLESVYLFIINLNT